MKKAMIWLLLALSLAVFTQTTGCAYGGIAGHKGKIYILRNDMFLAGFLRKVYVCIPQGTDIACSAANGSP